MGDFDCDTNHHPIMIFVETVLTAVGRYNFFGVHYLLWLVVVWWWWVRRFFHNNNHNHMTSVILIE
jgi:hypothetical protein